MNTCPLCRHPVIRAEELELVPDFNIVRRGERMIKLSATRFDLFQVLYERYPDPASSEEMITKVWGAQSDKLPKYLSCWFSGMRLKLRFLDVEILSLGRRSCQYVLRIGDGSGL